MQTPPTGGGADRVPVVGPWARRAVLWLAALGTGIFASRRAKCMSANRRLANKPLPPRQASADRDPVPEGVPADS
jgi:hypothetical protein